VTITEIATLYLDGLKMRKEVQELSNPELTKKFERGHRTISNVAQGTCSNVPEDEQDLIRACIAERHKLRNKAACASMARLCYLHKVSHHSIIDELVRMGEWGGVA